MNGNLSKSPKKDGPFVTSLPSDKLDDERRFEEQKKQIKVLMVPLDKIVDKIENQFVKVLDNHETDFKSAYRVSTHQFKF